VVVLPLVAMAVGAAVAVEVVVVVVVVVVCTDRLFEVSVSGAERCCEQAPSRADVSIEPMMARSVPFISQVYTRALSALSARSRPEFFM
jgi:hypothetical protein